MTTDLKTVDENAAVEDIVELMEKYRIKRVPVMSGSILVGIITRSNLMHAMVSMARVAPDLIKSKDDAGIRDQLLEEMNKERWAPVALTNVVVHDGVVELWGVLVDERQREALKVVAENIPGVKAVKDHMVWVEPMTGMAIEAQGEAENRPQGETTAR